MTLFHLFVVAAIQGLTEFLPVSSSGHLVLLPALTNLQDQGLALDVAVHVGSLFAVVLYFWSDVKIAFFGTLRLLQGKVDTQGAFLALCLLAGTIPVVVVGFVLNLFDLQEHLRSAAVVGWTMLGFGLVLFWADKTGKTDKSWEKWTLKDAAIMGLAQVLALIPGTSRSGITITAARRLGYNRDSAARLAMLMSIPVIVASGLLLATDVAATADWNTARDGCIAALFAFVTALLSISVMMRLLKSVSFTPYVVYRVLLGIGLLVFAYS